VQALFPWGRSRNVTATNLTGAADRIVELDTTIAIG
jgi:hypothetical protein